jgi:NAD-dependent DNA ligase
MTDIDRLNGIVNSLKQGNLSVIDLDVRKFMNSLTVALLNLETTPNAQDIMKMGILIHISNILWNNTDKSMMPLEDGMYDLLLDLYKIYNPMYLVGAEPIHFEASNHIKLEDTKPTKPVTFVDKEKVEDFIFYEDITSSVKLSRKELAVMPVSFKQNYINKRIVNTKHVYPTLVGTLDKCKFVLYAQADEKGVANIPNVTIFERDFLRKHIEMGIINMHEEIELCLELKYDGVSVEAEVDDMVESARSRGDANQDIAADLSPILYGYKFKHSRIPKGSVIGAKFEAIMTYENLYWYNQAKGKDYKNCRTAISGLFSSSDAAEYRNFITLVPLAVEIDGVDMDRRTEIEFMNTHLHSGEQLRYTIVRGNYIDVLFQVKRFVEEAEYMRSFMPFMYDGVVVSYTDKNIIEKLGRVNAVNKYSVAIKFNPLKKQTIFRGYTFNVGQDGTITPMIHYDPVEFYGTIHDKSSGHSYARFMNLSLKVGDIIDVEYTADVMPYPTKPDNSHNANNTNEVVPFINECPSCHGPLELSSSGKSMKCENISCPERNMRRMVNMLDKLNLKDFSEAAILGIAKYSLSDLFKLTRDNVLFLGDVNSQKFMDRINELRTIPIYDYRIVGSLGFTDIAVEKWKLILNKYTLIEILSVDTDTLRNMLCGIKGIGPMTINTICDEFKFFKEDLHTIASMSNLITSKGLQSGKSIRFAGFRDKELAARLSAMGYDANDKASVTRTTDLLIVSVPGYTSGSTAKAGPNTVIVPLAEFLDNMDKYL